MWRDINDTFDVDILERLPPLCDFEAGGLTEPATKKISRYRISPDEFKKLFLFDKLSPETLMWDYGIDLRGEYPAFSRRHEVNVKIEQVEGGAFIGIQRLNGRWDMRYISFDKPVSEQLP